MEKHIFANPQTTNTANTERVDGASTETGHESRPAEMQRKTKNILQAAGIPNSLETSTKTIKGANMESMQLPSTESVCGVDTETTPNTESGIIRHLPHGDDDSLLIMIEQFKRVYKEKGSDDLQSQLQFLKALAKVYLNRAQVEPATWIHFLRAHALFNSCSIRDKENIEVWKRKIYEVEEMYFGGKHPLKFEDHQDMNDRLCRHLNALRQKLKRNLYSLSSVIEQMDPAILNTEQNELIEKCFIEEVRTVSETYTQEMKTFLAQIILASIKTVGAPPCDFAAVGIGSIARGEITPYSDIEYLFLVEDNANKAYFERLAVASYFIIGHLGETNLKCMSINEFSEAGKKWFEDRARSGIRIDGIGGNAGNIPTGNEDGTKYLIRTPEELAEIFKKSNDNPSIGSSHYNTEIIDMLRSLFSAAVKGNYRFEDILHKRKALADLSDMLKSTTVLFSHNAGGKLYEEFIQRIGTFQTPPQRELASLLQIITDLQEFNFLPTDFSPDCNRLLDIKKDLFRFLTILYEDLKILLDLATENSWKTVERIIIDYQLTDQTAHGMRFLLAVALFIRLDAYSFYGAQKDKATVLTSEAQHSTERVYCFPRKLFHGYASFLYPLKSNFFVIVTALLRKRSLCYSILGSDSHHNVDIEHHITRDTAYATILSHAYCLEWADCLKNLQESILDGPDTADVLAMHDVMQQRYTEALFLACVAAIGCKSYNEALVYSSTLVELIRSGRLHVHWDEIAIAHIYGLQGVALKYLQRNEEELIAKKKALHAFEEVYGVNATQQQMATALTSVGNSLLSLGVVQEALSYNLRSMNICETMYGVDAQSLVLATCYSQCGTNLLLLSKKEEAFSYHQKAMHILESAFGKGAVNSDLAVSYNNIAVCLELQERHQEALSYHRKAMEIREELFGPGSKHEHLASSYSNMGNCLYKLGDYRQALSYKDKSMDMLEDLLGVDVINNDLARDFFGAGLCWLAIGEYQQSLSYLLLAIRAFETLTEVDAPSVDLLLSYKNAGSCLKMLGRHQEALSYLQRAAAIQETLSHGSVNFDLACRCYDVGVCMLELARHQEALSHLERSTEILESLYGVEALNTTLAINYNTVGSCLQSLGRYKDALPLLRRSLSIQEALLGPEATSKDLARVHNNIAYVLHFLGEKEEAFAVVVKAYRIAEKLYTSEDNDEVKHIIASICDTMGCCLQALGRLDEAIPLHEKAISLVEILIAPKTLCAELAAMYSNFANCLNSHGQTQQALSYRLKAVQICEALAAGNNYNHSVTK